MQVFKYSNFNSQILKELQIEIILNKLEITVNVIHIKNYSLN